MRIGIPNARPIFQDGMCMEDTVTAAYSEGQFSLTGSGILARVRRYWLNILLGILLTGSSSLLFFVDRVLKSSNLRYQPVPASR